MAADREKPALGPWANANLARTAHEHAGIGATSDLPDDVRFISGIVQLVRTRLARTSEAPDPLQPAVFLLEPVPRALQEGPSPKRAPMLESGTEPLNGRLWFVGAAVISGHYVPVGECDDDSLFQLVTSALELGNVPAVLFDPKAGIPEVRFYPSGLGNPEDRRKLPLNEPNISLERLLEAIRHIHDHNFITPDAQPTATKLWKDSDRWWPVENAEAIIQSILKAGLTSAFPACTVRHEQPSIPGRVDLEIEEHDALDRSVIVRHAVLELKVLRSFRSTGTSVAAGETEEWIEAGVRQAAAYREDKGARNAALCCFDMRRENTGESCFDHVLGLAARGQVELWRWFLFASSAHYRSARFP